MTCIVGLTADDIVWIGGDSAGVAGYSLSVRSDQKVWKSDPFVFGFTTSFRMGQLLRYKLNVPEQYPSQTVDEFMCGPFIDAVRQCLKDGGFATDKSGEETGGTFLAGYRGRLFNIGGDYQVGEASCGFDAVGCGEDLALGALFASEKDKPKDRVLQALEASQQFSAGVREPFTVVSGGEVPS